MKVGKFVKKYQTLLAGSLIAAVILVAVVVIVRNPSIINLNSPSGGLPPTQQGPDVTVNLPTPAPNNLKPTSLYVTVSPTSAPRGSYITGEVTSNGYNYPCVVHAKHVGANAEVQFGGLIDDYGKFWHSQTMDTCGHWDFWVTCDSVTSNTAHLTITGIQLYSEETFYSRSFDTTGTWKVYSSVTGSCGIFANDPAHGVSIPLTTVTVNSGGYAQADLNFGSLSLGTYEVDCVINGQKASDFGCSVNITIGR